MVLSATPNHEQVAGHTAPSTQPLLHVADLWFSYPGTPNVLRGVTFVVGARERVGIVGHNGSGKTSLLLTICGVLQPSHGRILFEGIPIRPGTFHPEIGFVFQDPDDQLFSPTVADDLAFGPMNMGLSADEVAQRVQAALDEVGGRALAQRPPHHLSGGEKRMVAIASVLTMRPKLILYDEPDANLDCRARQRLIRFLQRSSGAALVASHNLSLIQQVCQRTLLMHHGSVIADGETRTVLHTYRQLCSFGASTDDDDVERDEDTHGKRAE